MSKTAASETIASSLSNEHERLALPGLIETADDPDLDSPSITETNGTVARFNMEIATEAAKVQSFGPPRKRLIAPLLFLAGAVAFAGVIGAGYGGASNSPLKIWVVEGDAYRPFPAWAFATFIAVCALGTLLRTMLMGVVVRPDGLETREVLMFGVPRIRVWTWTQIDRFIFDQRGTMLELWDNRYERLPAVANVSKLHSTLMHVAALRNKTVTQLERNRENEPTS
jgi:hypothetical protein